MEVKNNLLNFKDKYIYQNTDWFMFSLDSVLLANFVSIKKDDKVIVDLATGNAPIAMLLSFRTNAKIYGVELQKEIFELGKKSVKENKMDLQISLINADIDNISSVFKSESVDVIVCNPPYFKTDSVNHLNNIDIKTIARHEVKFCLDMLFKNVRLILKNKGVCAIVHRPDRLIEIITKMKEYGIEPKRLQFCYPKNGKNANIVLIEGIKNGNSGIKVLPPIIAHNDSGEYTDEIKKYFGE